MRVTGGVMQLLPPANITNVAFTEHAECRPGQIITHAKGQASTITGLIKRSMKRRGYKRKCMATLR